MSFLVNIMCIQTQIPKKFFPKEKKNTSFHDEGKRRVIYTFTILQLYFEFSLILFEVEQAKNEKEEQL